MFQGAAQLNLDSKGRIAIPARHRDALLERCEGSLVLTADADGCLLVYPQPEMAADLRQIKQALIVQCAESRTAASVDWSCQCRGHGWCWARADSADTAQYAALDKHVMLVGQGNKFELWDEAKWQAQQEVALTFMQGELPPELEGSRCERGLGPCNGVAGGGCRGACDQVRWYLCGRHLRQGGHSKKILERLGANGKLIALDKDPAAVAVARRGAIAVLLWLHRSFGQLPDVLRELGVDRVDGILLDLGVSSPQLDEAIRGFSFRFDCAIGYAHGYQRRGDRGAVAGDG